MNIYEKLNDIQEKLVVSKNKYNEFGNFNYRSAEDILQAVKPYLKEHKLVLLLTDEVIQIGERNYIKATATLTDGESKIETHANAREQATPKAKMDESQTTGSASSYARKFALSGLFALDDGIDSDSLNKSETKKAANEKTITKTQKEELRKFGVVLEDVAKYLKVNSVDEIPYEQAKKLIDKKKKAGTANEKN